MRLTPEQIEYLRLRLASIKASADLCNRKGWTEGVAIYVHRQFELADFIRRNQ